MTLPRRQFMQLALASCAAMTVPRAGWSQTYPARPVRLVAPFPAGGTVDVYARLIGQALSERLGQPFIIENRAGAGGNIGTESVVNAVPDGYTLLQITSSNAWNTTLYPRLSFNFQRDIVPIASIQQSPGILAVHPSFPSKSVPELIAYARANPGAVNMASGGVGSGAHVYGELFKMMTGVDMLHVPYRGGAPALVDLLAGQVSLMFDTFSTSIEHVRSGRLRALAVTSAARVGVLPDIPAVGEFVPGYEATGWQGIGGPRGMPAHVVDKLNKEVSAILSEPRVRTRIADLGGNVFESSPAEFERFIAEYIDKWAKVIDRAGVKLD